MDCLVSLQNKRITFQPAQCALGVCVVCRTALGGVCRRRRFQSFTAPPPPPPMAPSPPPIGPPPIGPSADILQPLAETLGRCALLIGVGWSCRRSVLDSFYLFSYWFAGFTRFSIMSSSSILGCQSLEFRLFVPVVLFFIRIRIVIVLV